MKATRKGMLMVISGPSGTGKGTLAAKLLNDDPSFTFSVSATTRAKRSTEIEDVHYHFLSDEEYDKLLAEDAFLEHATVHGHRYGTLKSEVYERMEKGQNVLLDIDPQGARMVMEQEPECVSVFILPPSYKALRVRLHTRNTDDPVEIERRLGQCQGGNRPDAEVSICCRQRRAGASLCAAVRHCDGGKAAHQPVFPGDRGGVTAQTRKYVRRK